ncbi:non-specific lipid-transfer protein-like protein At2g13820 isoform X1 [Ananas comosus]|uniref:Non-specific lipid-transfer protein-like protein At2g13820 isoform X1 n=1 Tax=Ananas comosus TaxID=4615 RepID=A0A6P5G9N6_ANACO|nr:non-specific lipid-transfer protein-like protein At2g13820 isoform X1 [Ananas comosus]
MAPAGRLNIMALLALFSLLLLATSASAGGSAAPAPAADCSAALLSLADCLTYVEVGSKAAKPEGGCCSGLKKVVREEVGCLCQAFQGSQDLGVSLNVTKALSLPSACKVSTPPFTKCNISVAGVPGPAPAPSPRSEGGAGFLTAPAPSPVHSTAVEFPASTFYLLFSVAASLFPYYFL